MRVRPARAEDAGRLAPVLRAADLREIQANLGEDPRLVLARSLAISDPCYAAVDERDQPMALFGAAPDLRDADVGMVWLLGSDALAAHAFSVARHSRAWVGTLQQRYRVLWNRVDSRNDVHIRWLRWCGFTVVKLIQHYGVERRPFYEFEKVRDA